MSGLFNSVKTLGKFAFAKRQYDTASQWQPSMGSLYDLKANDLDGRPFDLSKLKGKIALVCNVASECGYVSHTTQRNIHTEPQRGRETD